MKGLDDSEHCDNQEELKKYLLNTFPVIEGEHEDSYKCQVFDAEYLTKKE